MLRIIAGAAIGFVLALIVTMVIAFRQRQPDEPSAAMQARGQRSAPIIMVVALIGGAVGAVTRKRR